MLILPPKFKQALGNGVRTSLYPLVRIYKGYQIDDTIPDDAESINLSIKETNIGGEAYNPLLLNSPSISSKADIINNKYTISSVSLSISNALYNGKMFSDDIPSLLNAVVQVYYAANGLDTLDDCLLVYTGTIRRYSQSAESLKLTLEDLTEQKLTTKIPATLIEDEDLYTDEQIGKPYPMVYGYVDGSPIIKRNLDTLEIEKPSKEIFGYWSGSDSYQNPSIQEGHPLVDSGHLKRNHYLSVYKDGFMPIYETGPKDWGSYYHENVDGAIFYEFNFADTDNSPNIILKPEAYLDTTQPNDDEETFAIPSRMYRPIINVSFYAKNTPNPPPLYCSNNKFIGYKDDDGSMQTITNNIVVVDDPDAHDNSESIAKDLYDEFWDGGPNEGDILKFWEPSEINAAYDLGTEGETSADFYDLNWKQFYNDNAEAAKFPIDIIQNADENSGLHITSVNRGEYFETGAFARLHLNEVGIVGDFPCVTKIKYDACFFSNGNIQNYTGYTNQGTQPRFASFWTDRHLKFIGTNTPDFINTLDQWYYHIGSYMALPPSFPNNINEMVITERDVDNNYPDYARLEYEDGLLHDDFHDKILGFNTTNAFDSIQFGTGVFLGNQGVNYVSANLKEIYVLQDFIIEDYANLDYYASVGGRVKDGDIITTAQDILEDILKDELLYEGVINNQNTNIQNEWQYAFTLNEQKEAKQVFEDIFKSSLLIPSFNSSGQFKFIGIKQLINNYSDVVFINTEDVIKYSFQLTKLDDVYNSVNIKYKKSYGSGEYDKQTGYEIGNTIHTTLDDYTTTELGYGGNNAYDINYYGLDSEDAKLEVETEYIRDKYTAARLQKRLLLWHCNQHLITKVDLPAHYIHLEAGDYIKYSELLGGKLAFGYDYSRIEHRNGQLMYPAFFITKVSKSLSKVSIEAVQVHRGEYGFPNLEADTDPNAEDEGDIVNGDGNDITDNNQLPDPQDDPNYNEDSIDTEEWDSIVDPFLRLDIPTLGILNDGTVHALVTTNMDELWEYNIWAKNISETFVYDGVTYNEGLEIPNGEIDASNLVSHALSMTDNNGIITIEKKFELYPEGAFIEFTLEVKNTADYQDEGYFTQFGETPWVFNEIYGDVNQDDILNVLDIVTIVTAILDATTDELPDDGEGRSIADITDDGQVNVLDLVQIVNEIVGQ